MAGIQNYLVLYSTFYVLTLCFLCTYLFIRFKTSKNQNSEGLQKTFINSKEKFLFFKPQTHLRNLDPLYGYFHFKGWDEWNFDKKDMERRFGVIKGLCHECWKNPAEVGYYEEGYMRGFSDHNEWIIPQKPPIPLCKQCAWRKIKPYLSVFSEGIARPYGGDGIYISTTTENK